jgi:hypothetical protein
VRATTTLSLAPDRTEAPTSDTSSARQSGVALAIAIGFLAVVAATLWWYVARQRRLRPYTDNRTWDSALDRLMMTTRWFESELAADVAEPTISPSESSHLWDANRATVADLERDVLTAQHRSADPDRSARAAELAAGIATLRRALDAEVRARRGEKTEGDELLHAAEDDVSEARAQLRALLQRRPASSVAPPQGDVRPDEDPN